jgi:phage head maturation protease
MDTMKQKVKIGSFIDKLKPGIKDAAFNAAKAEGLDVDNLSIERNVHAEKAKTSADIVELGPRESVQYVSTRTMDRDNEVILPKGIDLSEFKKYGHVLVNHDYSKPPIGSDKSIKADDFGIKAHTKFADTGEGTEANVWWQLVKQGHVKASSVGFMPLAWTQPGHADFEKISAKLSGAFPEFAKGKESISRIITRGMLLEHSFVSVPANPDSEVIQVAKSLVSDNRVLIDMGILPKGYEPPDPLDLLLPPPTEQSCEDIKAVIPYAKAAACEKSASWDATAEIVAADTDSLMAMSAWVDVENTDMKSAYKLAHHRADEGHALVWKGLQNAMGAILGARGGVSLPVDEVKGVYDHLAAHYQNDFNEKPPELREYKQGELKSMFPDLFEAPGIIRVISEPIKRESQVTVISLPKQLTQEQIIAKSVQERIDIARGRL